MRLDADIHIRLDKRIKAKLAKDAAEFGIDLSDYLRLILRQASRTPFKLNKGRLSA